ncbi:MAG: thiopeptide-type bacteriocin biosynthesis protein [Pseudonocardiaceae bacterium]
MSNQNTDSGWRQVNLWCDDWQAAEQMAVTQLQPLLTEAEDSKSSICWWFVRKGPSWRLRLRPADGGETATAFVDRVTTALMDQGAIRRWAEVVYEPEVHAFGGVAAMAVAHDLFSADSRHLLTDLPRAGPHRSPPRAGTAPGRPTPACRRAGLV